MPIPERRFTRTLLVVVALLCLSLLPPGAPLASLAPPVAHAATLTVTSIADSGAGSLRQAIIDAANGDTITFNLPASSTITLASQIDFSTELTIDGAGAPGLTISGNNANRVFRIGAPVMLANMTLANGLSPASSDGGAVYVFTTSPLTLTDVVVRGSVADDSGGGVYAAGPLTVRGGRFENNRTTGAGTTNQGGGVHAASTLAIFGTQIISNTAGFSGGVIAFGATTVSGARFESNRATQNIGALYATTLTLSDTQVISNSAQSTAGGIAVQGTATIQATRIERNVAQAAGGAYFAGTAALTNTAIISNVATLQAGGLYASGTIALNGIRIENNSAGQQGGGALIGGTVAITSTSFLSNTADVGGGAYVDGTAAITSTSFRSNTAQDEGGALFINGSSGSTIRTSRLFDNTALNGGGALYLGSASATMENTFVGGNTSQNGAAAIGLGGVTPSNLTATHTTFAAGTPGQGVAINAGKDIAGDTITMTNTLFDGYATALQAGPNAATITADGVLFSNVTTPTETLTTTASITVTNAYTGTAAFVDAAARDYHLTSASAAIDTGVASSVTTDIDGQPRPNGAAPDLGADEFSNTPPTAVDDSFTTPEDTPLTVPAPGVLGNDSDFDGDPLTAVLQTAPTTGTLVLNPDGAFTYTPPANFTGNVTWTYVANDGELDSQPATVTITVTPVNDPPTISAIANQTTAVDTPVGPVSFTVADADGDTLTVTASSSNTTLVPNGSIVLGGSGANRAVTITPATGQSGTATITLTVSDGTATASTTFTLTVTKSGTLGVSVYLPLVQR